MKKPVSVFVLPIVALAYVGFCLWLQPQLPDRVASHFNDQGAADGWTDRSGFTTLMLASGLGMAVVFAGIGYAIRFLPASLLNVPNRDYWRKPENHRRACGWIFGSFLWFGSALMIWQAALFHLVAKANDHSPAQLDNGKVMGIGTVLLAFVLFWVVALLRRFRKTG